MEDRWANLRENLWANTEPSVELVAMTCTGIADLDDIEPHFRADGIEYHPVHIESIVANAASVSTGASIKAPQALVVKLISMGHMTPLEAIQYNFRIKGLSKAAGAQLSRHRIGQGHVSASRRYREQGVGFVYPILDYIDNENDARQAYQIIQDSYQATYNQYLGLRQLKLKKGDARFVIPTATATERYWWVNARALRDFFRLRLAPDAESEIRRLAFLVYEIVSKITPNLFYDIEAE